MPPKRPWFELRRSSIQGRGAFASRDIPAGRRIIEYAGERISEEESSRRYDDSRAKRHHTFLFDLDDGTCIDARRIGNDARYINHSCEPNCESVVEGRRVFIHALTAIAAGDEIVYDYWYTTDDSYSLLDLQRIYPCRCRAPTCRGTLARPPRRRRKTG
jgi:hypothetical protein